MKVAIGPSSIERRNQLMPLLFFPWAIPALINASVPILLHNQLPGSYKNTSSRFAKVHYGFTHLRHFNYDFSDIYCHTTLITPQR